MNATTQAAYSFQAPQFDNIPQELRELPRWVTWSAEGLPGEKPRKVPYAPDRPNTRASSTDSTTWGTFHQAEAAFFEGDRTGVGIVLNGDGLVGVDIDHCVIDGRPSPESLALLDKLGAAYIEISPSGTGLRAIGYGDQLDAGVNGSNDGLKAEFYSTVRYLTLTGNTIKAGPIAALVGFKEVAESFRTVKKTKTSEATGVTEQTTPDGRHASMIQGVLSGDVYHDNLRDLASSMVRNGMYAGAVVNHLYGLMDASNAPHDSRWKARRASISDLVSSACRKFSPLPGGEYSGLTIDNVTGEVLGPLLKPVSVFDVLTNPAAPPGFVWDGYLPRGVVALMGAHGGTGKSTIALMLGVCAALGRPLFGVDTAPCKVLFVSLEDGSSVVRHRLAGICKAWLINPEQLRERLHIVDGTEHPELFAAETRGAGEITASYFELRKIVQSENIGLVLVDNASDAFGGDEIQRRQVRAFMRSLGEVARLTDCAVLLLAHVDKATSRNKKAEGGEGYSGSTAWHNSARSRLFLSRGDDGLLTLEHQKSNLGPRREPVTLEWLEGGLPQLVQGAGFDGDGFASRQQGRADDDHAIALLKLIAEFESRGQYCSPAVQARNNVHAMLKSEPAFLKLKLRPDDTKRIVNQCQRAKWLEPLDYRGHGRMHQRWAVTLAGRLFAGLPKPHTPTSPHIDDGDSADVNTKVGCPTPPHVVGGTGERAHTICEDVSATAGGSK